MRGLSSKHVGRTSALCLGFVESNKKIVLTGVSFVMRTDEYEREGVNVCPSVSSMYGRV